MLTEQEIDKLIELFFEDEEAVAKWLETLPGAKADEAADYLLSIVMNPQKSQ